LIVAREGKHTTRAKEGVIIPFENIEQAAVAENPEKARKLYVVVRGRHVGKIGRCVGKWVNSSNQYDYRLIPVQIRLGSGIKWQSDVQENGVEFTASRWDLVAIHETAAQMVLGNNQVAHIRHENAGKFW
jgi:hypothetical protein